MHPSRELRPVVPSLSGPLSPPPLQGEVVAACGTPGPGAGEAGQGPTARSGCCAIGAPASQVAFAKRARWQVRQGPVRQVSDYPLDLGVIAMLLLGLPGRERGARKQGTVVPDGE
jgi:hypothetical protein